VLGQVRRLVTGHDGSGKAIIVEDGWAPAVHTFERRPGAAVTELWKTAATPAPIGTDADITQGPMQLAPPPGGSVFRVIVIAPETAESRARLAQDAKGAFGDIGAKGASTFKAGAPHPMMHRTETIDYGIVLEGEVYAVLEDSERLMKAGDVIVQRGTNHAWSNRSGKPCKMAFILIDGRFDPTLAAKFE
jgi:Cupin domain